MNPRDSTVVLVTACALLVSACGTARRTGSAPAQQTTGFGAIGPALQSYVDSGRLAGIRAVVMRDGAIVYDDTFGWMDIERREPMRHDAVFRIYSMTKPVVAAGALRLIEEGRLSLEDPVAKYIPAFRDVKVFAGGTAEDPILTALDSAMTVRHLLTHTAGLGYGIGNTPLDSLYQRAALFDPMATLEQFADSVARMPLYFSPGTAFKYGAAIDVLGRVIEVASGQALDWFMYEQIFVPAGMRHTSFRMRDDIADRVATMYAPAPGGGLTEVNDALNRMYDRDARFFWGGGGLLSTMDDYLRFAQMLQNGGELDGRRILSEESVALMMRNHLPAALTPLSSPPMMDEGYGYGLGGAVLVDSSRATLPGAEGIYRWSGYVGTYFWIDPVNDAIGMVWTQLTPGRTYPLEQEFQLLVYDALRN